MRLTLLSCTVALIAAPVFAADLGTYRPGTPYHSVIVPNANVCESQCDGDAQCRGWNYVKAATAAPGVCEFQSSISSPIASAISISGVSNSAMPMSSRVIEGNTNTIRVGTAVTAKPAQISETQGGRRVVRHAVPGQHPNGLQSAQPGLRPALGAYPNAQHQATRQRFDQPQGARPMVSRGPVRQPQAMRNTRPMTNQAGYAQPQYAQPYQGRPPIGQPIAPAPYQQPQAAPQTQVLQGQFQGAYAGQYAAQPQYTAQPQSYGQPQAYTQPQPYVQASVPTQRQTVSQPMPRSSATNPVSWDSLRAPQTAPQQSQPQNTSLYGQLNDDMGRAATMPTSQSYPSQPVQQMPLAGAIPR